jgi:long-chain acyl-CoA synthetase
VHSHGNIRYHLDAIATYLGFGPTDTFLAALPFFQLPAFLIHAGLALHVGATLVVMEKFEPQVFLDWIDTEDVTFFAGVPTIYQMLYDASQDRRSLLRKVRFGICAGAPLSMKLRQNFENQMGLRIVHCYGSTEIPLIAAFERPEEKPKGISVGNVAPHMRLRLVDIEGRVVPTGEAGEIQLGSENTLKYYWNNPEATDDAVRDGWFSTGDIGRFDEDAHLHIIDRAKDMIIRGGLNIYPAEIERVLTQAPGIREAVVVGIPHERLGEVPKAYVVLEANVHLSAEDVIALSREKIAAFKALAEVEIVDADFFPRNAMGKIQKNKLKRGCHEN